MTHDEFRLEVSCAANRYAQIDDERATFVAQYQQDWGHRDLEQILPRNETHAMSADMRTWRIHNKLSILTLKRDIYDADLNVARQTGARVLAGWHKANEYHGAGWLIKELPFFCILRADEVYIEELNA